MIRLVSWNIARRAAPWAVLRDVGADVALLQEAGRASPEWGGVVFPDPAEGWSTALPGSGHPWRAGVVRLSERVQLEPRPNVTIESSTGWDDWVISRAGTIAAADVYRGGEFLFTAVSVYAPWESVASRGYADGSAHRILSDLSHLVGRRNHRVVVAGDWNLLRGYGEYGNSYWRQRYDTVFERAEVLGLTFAGPMAPNGVQSVPWPDELPPDSLCVPTFHHSRQRPETATRQLDFVFVSDVLAKRVEVRALNGPDEWGPSDHCRIVIDVDV